MPLSLRGLSATRLSCDLRVILILLSNAKVAAPPTLGRGKTPHWIQREKGENTTTRIRDTWNILCRWNGLRGWSGLFVCGARLPQGRHKVSRWGAGIARSRYLDKGIPRPAAAAAADAARPNSTLNTLPTVQLRQSRRDLVTIATFHLRAEQAWSVIQNLNSR